MAAVKGKKTGAGSVPARKPVKKVAGKRPATAQKKVSSARKSKPASSKAKKTVPSLKSKSKKASKPLARKAVARKVAKVPKAKALKPKASKATASKTKTSKAKAPKAKASKAKAPRAKTFKPKVSKSSGLKASSVKATKVGLASVRKAAVPAAAAALAAAKVALSKVKDAGSSVAARIAAKVAGKKVQPKPASVTQTPLKKTTGSKESSSKPLPASSAAAGTPGKVATAAPASRGGRRSKVKITGDGTVTAAWLINAERPRPSSFIPAPPRAESPFLVAAPPASSDRLIRPDDLKEIGGGIRTYTVRVDIEQSGGKTTFGIYPDEVSVRVGEGIEWDFRYLGGADASVDEVIIEFDKPSPFGTTVFKSRKPGSNRPHRLISGAAASSSVGKRVVYTIRALNLIKSEIARTKPAVTINPMPVALQNAST